MVAYTSKGKLYIRDLAQLEPVEVADSADTAGAFWSPDSKWVGYFGRNEIRKAASVGGSSRSVCKTPTAVQGADWTTTWDSRGVIVFAINAGGVFRVPADGGEPVMILDGAVTRTYDFHEVLFVGSNGDFITWTHKGCEPQCFRRLDPSFSTRAVTDSDYRRLRKTGWRHLVHGRLSHCRRFE